MRIARTAAIALALGALTVTFAAAQQAPAPPPPPPPPAAKPELKVIQAEAVHAIVLPMKGSYMQHMDAFQQVGAAVAKLAVAPAGPMFARYFAQPGMPEADQVWEVGIAVPASVTKVEAPFVIQEIPASKMVVRVHTGPPEELETAWPAFVGEVMGGGYTISGPPVQIFATDGSLEMRLPIQ
jgi:effector-binding domain-containing protein